MFIIDYFTSQPVSNHKSIASDLIPLVIPNIINFINVIISHILL